MPKLDLINVDHVHQDELYGAQTFARQLERLRGMLQPATAKSYIAFVSYLD